MNTALKKNSSQFMVNYGNGMSFRHTRYFDNLQEALRFYRLANKLNLLAWVKTIKYIPITDNLSTLYPTKYDIFSNGLTGCPENLRIRI